MPVGIPEEDSALRMEVIHLAPRTIELLQTAIGRELLAVQSPDGNELAGLIDRFTREEGRDQRVVGKVEELRRHPVMLSQPHSQGRISQRGLRGCRSGDSM